MNEATELRKSRARLAASAGADRRRIERALHDGVQQDLIALSVRLQLLRELLPADAAPGLELLDELQQETHLALERVQALSADVYPSMLDVHGVEDALRQAVTNEGGAVVEAEAISRRAPEIERAVYFSCRAALDSSGPAAELTIRLREDGRFLVLEMTGAPASCLPGARDLLEAAGGTVDVDQSAGGSVRLRAAF